MSNGLDRVRLSNAYAEVSRELFMRGALYDRLIQQGRMTPQEAAQRRAAMTDAQSCILDAIAASQGVLPRPVGKPLNIR